MFHDYYDESEEIERAAMDELNSLMTEAEKKEFNFMLENPAKEIGSPGRTYSFYFGQWISILN